MKNLAIAFCLLLTVSVISADLLDAYFKRSADLFPKCGKELGIDGTSPRAIFEKDTKSGQVTCLRACLLKGAGLMQNSKMLKDKLVEYAQSAHSDTPELIPKLLPIITECIAKVQNIQDECQLAHSYMKCYLEKAQ